MAKFWKKPNGQTSGWLMAAEVGWPFDLALETNEAGQAGGEVDWFQTGACVSCRKGAAATRLQPAKVIRKYWPREADLHIFQAMPNIYKSQYSLSQNKL